jgi:hypothetical protein
MGIQGLIHVRKALNTLNPKQVRELSERPARVALHAATQESYQRMENFFLQELSPARRRESALLLTRAPISPLGQGSDIAVYDEGVIAPAGALIFKPEHTEQFVRKTLKAHEDLGVTLAKSFHPFRRPFVEHIVDKTARENALFSMATALPDIIPTLIELPWAVAEFASDTAFLTMNQIKMAFLIAAASDREVGYREQKSEIATVIGSAFGWRALARQVVSKVPFGGGLIGKTAVAYAATKVLGLSLDHFYSIGFTYARDERDRIYADAFRQGKVVAARILRHLRPDLAAKFAESARQNMSAGPTARSAGR